MRTTKRLVLAIASLSLLGAGGCTRKSAEQEKAEVAAKADKEVAEVRTDASKEVAEVRTDEAKEDAKIDAEAAKKERDTFVKTADERLDKVKDRIDGLDRRVEKQVGDVRVTASTELVELKGGYEQAKTMLKELDDEAKLPGWAQIRADVDTKITDLDRRLNALDSRMTAH